MISQVSSLGAMSIAPKPKSLWECRGPVDLFSVGYRYATGFLPIPNHLLQAVENRLLTVVGCGRGMEQTALTQAQNLEALLLDFESQREHCIKTREGLKTKAKEFTGQGDAFSVKLCWDEIQACDANLTLIESHQQEVVVLQRELLRQAQRMDYKQRVGQALETLENFTTTAEPEQVHNERIARALAEATALHNTTTRPVGNTVAFEQFKEQLAREVLPAQGTVEAPVALPERCTQPPQQHQRVPSRRLELA